MNRKLLTAILCVLLLSCDDNEKTIVGLWEGETGNIMISENKDYYILETADVEAEYIKKSADKIKVKNNQIFIESKNKKQRRYIKPKNLAMPELWAISVGMKKNFFESVFIPPDTIVTSQAGAEKWFYPQKLVVIFDEKEIIKIDQNQKVNQNFSDVQIGMSASQILELLGKPDRKNFRETKWYYGIENQFVFRDDKLFSINVVDRNSSFSEWRAEALKTFDDTKLVKRDLNKIRDFFSDTPKEYIVNFQIDDINSAYGVKEKQDFYLPLIIFAEVDQKAFPPSMYKLEKELTFYKEKQEAKINKVLSKHIKRVHIEPPSLDKERQLIEITTTIQLNNGEILVSKQAVFFRFNQMLLIQMSLAKEDENLFSYFTEILQNFDL